MTFTNGFFFIHEITNRIKVHYSFTTANNTSTHEFYTRVGSDKNRYLFTPTIQLRHFIAGFEKHALLVNRGESLYYSLCIWCGIPSLNSLSFARVVSRRACAGRGRGGASSAMPAHLHWPGSAEECRPARCGGGEGGRGNARCARAEPSFSTSR